MHKTVITVNAVGETQHTRGDRIASEVCHSDTAKKRMERVTEIMLDEKTQGYVIFWLLGVYKGLAHSVYTDTHAWAGESPVDTLELLALTTLPPAQPNVLVFKTYEDAVKHEVATLAQMRKRGVTF